MTVLLKCYNDNMSSFVEAAYEILKTEGAPLNTKNILEKALARGIVQTKGKTPQQTLWSSLYSENKRRLKRGEKARFEQQKMNVWGLTEWNKNSK